MVSAREDMAEGIDSARRAGAETWEPPVPSAQMKLACLERWYWFVRQKQTGLSLSGQELFKLEPSGLTEMEVRQWYWGLRAEAARRTLAIANTSYSKSAIREAMEKEGLGNALILMDPGTLESYRYVVKFLSD